MKHRRRNRPFYRTSIALLSLVVLAIAQVVGWQVLVLSQAIAKADLLAEFASSGIILGCLIAVFLLIWAMVSLSKKKYVRRSESERPSRVPARG